MNEIIKIDKNESIKVDKPNTCPHCQKGINPVIVETIFDDFHNQPFLYIAFKCPVCEQIFFAKYFLGACGGPAFLNLPDFIFHFSEIIGGHGLIKQFSKEINDLSQNFVALYNDAYKAEQHNLQTIVGISYRLALEYLVKDYCITTHGNEKDDILKKNLSQCINGYLDKDIQEITKRAAWLGNDFSHYESKHPDMKIDDLKDIIDICVSKIETKIKEANYLKNIEKK